MLALPLITSAKFGEKWTSSFLPCLVEIQMDGETAIKQFVFPLCDGRHSLSAMEDIPSAMEDIPSLRWKTFLLSIFCILRENSLAIIHNGVSHR